MKNYFFYSIIVILFLGPITINAQSKSELKETFDEAEYFFLREDYSEALYFYLQLHKHQPDNASLNYKIGTCFLNIKGAEDKAIPFLEKAIKNTTINYKKRSFNEKRAPFHAYFYLGNAYRINNEIDKALEIYNKFINSPDFYGNYNERIVRDEIKSCERAKIIKDKPIEFSAKNIGEPINTESANYNPVISGDGSTMVFMTTLKFYEGIFFSRKVQGKWTDPINLNPQVISDGDMFPTCLSYDGKELYLVKKEEIQNDLYYSKFEEGRWTQAIMLNDNINTRFNEDHASVSKDNMKLYFTSDRRGGEGNFDIYVSNKTDNGEWGESQNLGAKINSPFNERTPYITENGQNIYFSSDGHFNMGGYDIFYSQYKNNEWQLPINIGYPINTTGDNLFFVPADNGKVGYMSLESDDSFGSDDIYKITIGPGSSEENQNIMSSLEKQEQNEQEIMLMMINIEESDTMTIMYNKNTNRFNFDIPDNYKIIVEEK